MLVRINRDPNPSETSGGAAPSSAQPSTETQVGASAGASQNAEGGNPSQNSPEGNQPNPPPAHNFKEIGARLTRGDILSDDEHSAFMEHLASGDFDKENKPNDDEDDESVTVPLAPKEGDKPNAEDEKSSDPDADPILEAMRMTGAKKAEELPGLIKGLRDAMTASGGKLGEQVKSLSETLQTQHSILTGIANGDPQAIADFQRITGKQVPANLSQSVQQPNINPSAQVSELDATIKEIESSIMSDEEVENSIDPVSAKRINDANKAQLKLTKLNHAQMEKIQSFHNQNIEKQNLERAQEQVFSEMDELAKVFSDDYGKITPAEIRRYVKAWEVDGTVHPKFEPMVKALQFAAQRGISLNDAHKLLNFEKKTNAAPLIQKSLAEQRQKILNQPVPNSISQNNNNGEAVVTTEMVQSWLKPDGVIPEQYMGENGLDASKLPKNIQKAMGL